MGNLRFAFHRREVSLQSLRFFYRREVSLQSLRRGNIQKTLRDLYLLLFSAVKDG